MNRFDSNLAISPLEQFVRDYVDAREGAWDEIEPQVYDVLLDSQMLQVAFDPEALPEHPRAQLASLGAPMIDRFLGDAQSRWNAARLYRTRLNLHPHDLESRLRRALMLPQDLTVQIESSRPLNFPQAVFWFKTSFVGDQKEEEILPLGIDLHHLRPVRHLEELLQSDRLSDVPESLLPEAHNGGLVAGYRVACRHVAPTAGALANARRRDWTTRVEKQIARMTDYYAQLRQEAREQAARDDNASARAVSRIESIDREEALRTSELRQKSAVRTQVRLLSLLLIEQPKLLIEAHLVDKNGSRGHFQMVWDSLSESMEPIDCPRCGQPTFALDMENPRGPRIQTPPVLCGKCANSSRGRGPKRS
ncbi:MAG TPA: hypothetical protein VK797_28730 [Tepidisphaeraceae bacterium]|nr:hypothetical protein [Tepidisphaeraceae bacterium]